MSAVDDLMATYTQSIQVYPERSRLDAGYTEVAYHCDKFNTRIIKGMEDILGLEAGRDLVASAAEKSTHVMLGRFFEHERVKAAFAALDAHEKLELCLRIFALLGYGKVVVRELSETKVVMTAAHSYLAEGWLENQERWHWLQRQQPVCHDTCGYLAAALCWATGNRPGTYNVVETTCCAAGADVCTFVSEVS